MFFHALTFAGSRGSCLNTRPLGRVFKHRPRDMVLMQCNKHVQSLFLHILPDFSINRADNVAENIKYRSIFLHLISQNKMVSASTFERHYVATTRI